MLPVIRISPYTARKIKKMKQTVDGGTDGLKINKESLCLRINEPMGCLCAKIWNGEALRQ